MKTQVPEKYVLEYIFIASPKLLYHYLSTAIGLTEWFAEKVEFIDGVFHFYWEETEQKAVIDSKKENDHIRYKWLDDENNTYFEFKIDIDSVFSENTLIVTDFALPEDIKESKMVWDAAIKKMLRIIGGKLISGISS
jgi:hypothetical protein